jgi:hypothetical protein
MKLTGTAIDQYNAFPVNMPTTHIHIYNKKLGPDAASSINPFVSTSYQTLSSTNNIRQTGHI